MHNTFMIIFYLKQIIMFTDCLIVIVLSMCMYGAIYKKDLYH
jgi:hypothetical protein